MQVHEVYCDKCGTEGYNERTHPEKSIMEYNEIHHIELNGGYGSKFPYDLCKFEVDLCGNCLEELLGEYGRHTDHGELIEENEEDYEEE